MAKPKVLLLNPPSSRVQIRDFYCSVTSKADYCWAPIDLLVMSARLDGACELSVVDAIGEALPREQALERALAARPELVISLTSSASLSEDAEFLSELKRRALCRVAVCGNVCLDRRPWLLEAHPWIDAAIRDFASPDVLRLAQGESVRVVGGADVPAGPLRYGAPRHDLFPLGRYRLPYGRGGPLATVMAGYGCPHSCAYCIQGRGVIGYRARPVPDVVAELQQLRRLGARELYFRDPLFGADRKQALALCEAMTGLGFSWSCDCRVDRVDAELLGRMKRAGCSCVAFGVESADAALLERQGKSISPEQTRRAIALCRDAGILSAGYFILGLPGQDEASALETIRFAAASGLDFASFSAAVPDHGTALREEALAAGRAEAGAPSADRNRAARSLSDRLNDQALERLLREAVWTFYARPSFILKTLARLRSPADVLRSARAGAALLRHLS